MEASREDSAFARLGRESRARRKGEELRLQEEDDEAERAYSREHETRRQSRPAFADNDPETGRGGGSGGMTGWLAGFSRNLPFVGALGELSLTHALRWLLWLGAVLFSLAGLGLVVAGAGAGMLALGSASAAAMPVLADASSTAQSAALSVGAAGRGIANVQNLSSGAAMGLANLSIGLNQTADNLDRLGGLSILPGLGSIDFRTPALSLRQSAAAMSGAGLGAQAGGESLQEAAAQLGAVADSLNRVSSDLDNVKAQVASAIFWAQVGLDALGAAGALLLTGVLGLALAYGPPKKN
jgi:hypothetical protein